MSLQRKINRSIVAARFSMYGKPLVRNYRPEFKGKGLEPMDQNKPDKGQANGSCNRTACQAPLADEPAHQFMDGNFTGGIRLHYCEGCALEFDRWDHRSGDAIRIKREPKICT
jgi:hypothetical protein